MPIIYFLPIDFNIKGKITIMLVVPFFSIVALIATPFLSIWKTILIVVLLIGLTSYIMAKKIEYFVTSNEETMKGFHEVGQFKQNNENPNNKDEERVFLEREIMLVDESNIPIAASLIIQHGNNNSETNPSVDWALDEFDLMVEKVPESLDGMTNQKDKDSNNTFEIEDDVLPEFSFEDENQTTKGGKEAEINEEFWENLLEEYDWDILKEQSEGKINNEVKV